MKSTGFITFLLCFFVFVSCESGKEEFKGQLKQTDLSPREQNYVMHGEVERVANPSYLSGPTGSDCFRQKEVVTREKPIKTYEALEPIDRPEAGDSAQVTYKKCLNWAKVSALRNPAIRTLTINYEGLASYSGGYAEKMYQYYDDLADGKNARDPGKAMMSFMASNIIRPNLKSSVNKSDFLLLPHTDTTSKPYVSESCIKAWREVHGADFKLKIMGHSFGGNSSRILMQSLKENQPDLKNIEMLLVDARSANPLNYVNNFKTEDNIRKSTVFFQKGLVMPGYPFDGPNTTNTQLSGNDIPNVSTQCGGLNIHARTTCSPRVQQAFQNMMNR